MFSSGSHKITSTFIFFFQINSENLVSLYFEQVFSDFIFLLLLLISNLFPVPCFQSIVHLQVFVKGIKHTFLFSISGKNFKKKKKENSFIIINKKRSEYI